MRIISPASTLLCTTFCTVLATAAIDRGGIARGRLDLNQAVMVNGVAYNTSQSLIEVDGMPGTLADLKPGQVVDIVDIVYVDGGLPTAGIVRFADAVQGPVEEVMPTGSALRVLGQIVHVTGTTLFGGGFTSLAGINPGDFVEVSGLNASDGSVVATRIDPAPSALSEVTGRIVEMGVDTLRINDLHVDISNAKLIGLTQIEVGAWVEAQGRPVVNRSGSMLVADAVIARRQGLIGEALQEASLEGFVTRFVSLQDFEVDGTPIVVNADTEFNDGTPADVVLGAFVDVEGELDESGTMLVAEEIEFEDLADDADDSDSLKATEPDRQDPAHGRLRRQRLSD